MEAISDQDDNKQFEQVRAAIARKVDGIIIVQTIPTRSSRRSRCKRGQDPDGALQPPAAKTEAFSVAIQATTRRSRAMP